MRFLLGGLVVLFNLLDNATTFLCLRDPITHFEVYEANPIARWIFDGIGLTQGLAVETVITTLAVVYLIATRRVQPRFKLVLLGVLVLLPAWAVANNLQVMQMVGIEIPLI